MQCGVYRIWLGNCKTYRFEGVTLLTAFATSNLMSLTLVVAEVQSGSSTLHGFEVTPIVAKGIRTGDVISHVHMPVVVRFGSPPC